MKAKKTWLGPVLIAAVFGGTLFLVFREQSPGAVAAALGQVYPGYIALGLALMFCFVGWEALASCLTLRRLGQRAPYVRCLGYSFTGFVFSSITPSSSGGQPAQVYEMTRDGIPVAHGALVMLLNAVCYQTATPDNPLAFSELPTGAVWASRMCRFAARNRPFQGAIQAVSCRHAAHA